MKLNVVVPFLVLLLAVQAKLACAQQPSTSVFSDNLKTVAGELRIVSLDES